MTKREDGAALYRVRVLRVLRGEPVEIDRSLYTATIEWLRNEGLVDRNDRVTAKGAAYIDREGTAP